jgi:uncharacterized membrane protein YwzB
MTLSTVIFLTIFLPSLQLNIGKKKYLKTAKIIDESLMLAYVTILLNQVIEKDKQG